MILHYFYHATQHHHKEFMKNAEELIFSPYIITVNRKLLTINTIPNSVTLNPKPKSNHNTKPHENP